MFSKNTPNTKFHENLSSENTAVPCGQKTDGHIDMNKLIVAFRNPAKAIKMCLKPFYFSSCVLR